jgi:hypothetical protein
LQERHKYEKKKFHLNNISTFKTKKEFKCLTHNVVSRFYCENCDLMICSTCKIEKHDSHLCLIEEEMDEYVRDAFSFLKNQIQTLKENKKHLTEFSENLNQNEEE